MSLPLPVPTWRHSYKTIYEKIFRVDNLPVTIYFDTERALQA
jgi:hypothetical protein